MNVEEASFDKEKIKLSDLGDIQIIGAPSLSKLDTFDTRMLSVDMNTPLARAINAKWNEDAFLREFGQDSLN